MVRSLKKTKNVDFALFILDTYHDYKRLGKKKTKKKKKDLQSSAEPADPASDVVPAGQSEHLCVVPPGLYCPARQSAQSRLTVSFCPASQVSPSPSPSSKPEIVILV